MNRNVVSFEDLIFSDDDEEGFEDVSEKEPERGSVEFFEELLGKIPIKELRACLRSASGLRAANTVNGLYFEKDDKAKNPTQMENLAKAIEEKLGTNIKKGSRKWIHNAYDESKAGVSARG